MTLSVAVINQVLLTKTVLEIAYQIPGPSLIYHDKTREDEVQAVATVLSEARTIWMATIGNRPSFEVPQVSRSLIILGTSPTAIFLSIQGWRLWNPQNPVLILTASHENTLQWLSEGWRLTRATNITIGVLTNPVQFYTWFPYRKQECTTPKTLTQLAKNNIFPSKIPDDCQGCDFKAVKSTLLPMVISDTEGIETSIVLILMEKLNLNLSYEPLPMPVPVWIALSQNGTPINGFQLLCNNEVDLLFCNARISYGLSHLADYFHSHLEDDLVWFVPGPHAMPRATAIFRAFSKKAWTLICVTFILILVTTEILLRLHTKNTSSTLLHSIALNLNLSITVTSPTVLYRFSMIMFIYSVHITTAYQSSLIVFLTDIPRERAMETVEELAESKIRIEFLETYRTMVEAISLPYMKLLLNPKRSYWVTSMLLNGVAEGTTALLGPKTSFTYYVDSNDNYTDEHGYPKIIKIKKQFTSSALTMYMSMGHPLHAKLNKYVMYLFEAGFPDFFKETVKVTPRPIIVDRKPFQIENVEGAFYLLFIFIGISSIVFVGELIIMCLKRKNLSKEVKKSQECGKTNWGYRDKTKVRLRPIIQR